MNYPPIPQRVEAEEDVLLSLAAARAWLVVYNRNHDQAEFDAALATLREEAA